jgi:hypothetical protein
MLSLVEPVDINIRAARTMPAFLYDLVPKGASRRFLLSELKLPDGCFTIDIDRFKRGEIGAAPLDAYSLGHDLLVVRFLEVSPGRH